MNPQASLSTRIADGVLRIFLCLFLAFPSSLAGGLVFPLSLGRHGRKTKPGSNCLIAWNF